MHSKKWCAAALAALSMVVITGCGGQQAAKQDSAKAAGDEKQIVVYWGAMADWMQADISEFTKATGIQVVGKRLSSGSILKTLQNEKDSPVATVWFGGPADAQIQAKQEGLLEKYVSPNAAQIADKYKDKDGYWTGIYVGYLGFVSNEKLLKQAGLEAPKSWDDLLKPEFKGKIMVGDPSKTGTAYTFLATRVQQLGEEKALTYMAALDKQVQEYTGSGSAPAELAGQGKCMVGISFMHDGLKYRVEKVAPIVLSAPAEGTGYEIGAVSLVKGGPNQELGKKFIDWCLTRQAQEIGQKLHSFQFLTNPQATQPKQAGELAETKLINYDVNWAGEHRKELVAKWKQATGK